ncbi:MAG: PilZ domain-containing protein [Bdellovibrionia bacterium]
MWQNKTQKIRALAEAKKKERDYARLHIHFKRIAASIQILSLDAMENDTLPKLEVRAILNDLNTEGVGLYSHEALDPGQEILLTFEKPHFLEISAKVKWCQSYNANSHIITAQPFSYRMGVEFIIKKEEDVIAVQDFCDDMIKTYLGPPSTE